MVSSRDVLGPGSTAVCCLGPERVTVAEISLHGWSSPGPVHRNFHQRVTKVKVGCENWSSDPSTV